jgi:hypothetical protein
MVNELMKQRDMVNVATGSGWVADAHSEPVVTASGFLDVPGDLDRYLRKYIRYIG